METNMMFQSTERTYQALQSFKTVEEMNVSVKAHKKQHKDELTNSAYNVLDLISKFSCKFVGVSYLCQKKIAEKLEINYRTVQRAFAQLENLGIIKKFASKRVKGDKRQSSNIIVIQVAIFEEKVTELKDVDKCHPQCHPKEAPRETKKDIEYTSDTGRDEKIEEWKKQSNQKKRLKDGLVTKLPETLQKTLEPFFDADEIYSLAGTIFKAKCSVDKNILLENNEEEYYNSIMSVINALKRDKVTSLHGLMYHTIKATTRAIWLKERSMKAFGFSF